MSGRRPLGGDFVIPALALAFAVYFFVDIADLAWEAKANGVLIGVILVLLVAAQLVRSALRIARGEGSLDASPLWEPREATGQRLGLVVLTVLFIATLRWLGLTLGLYLAMLAALWLMGVRSRAVLVWLPLGVAAFAYGVFIALLQSDFPHGLVENLLR